MAKALALTETKVKSAKQGKHTDGRGLYLLVASTGSKLWHYRYSFEGREKLMALGSYPVVTLAAAREKHLEARRLLESGQDPMAQRKEEKVATRAASENSFASASEKWLEHWCKDKTARHVDDTTRRLEAITKRIGSRPIAEIEAPELVALVKTIESTDAEGIARTKAAPEIAKRALQICGQVFDYGITHGYCKRNPARDVKPSNVLTPHKQVNFARVDGRELGDLLRAIEVYHGAPMTRLAMKLLALTFVRTSELIEARWSEFDTDVAEWRIPAERMKMDTPHIIPLSTQAIEVLTMLRTLTGGSLYLFPGDRGNATMSNNTILKALERMGYKGKHTGHGFRGVASTLLHEQGYDHAHIELQLAHSKRDKVSASYNHALYLKPRAVMMQEWADHLESTQRGKVLTMAAVS